MQSTRIAIPLLVTLLAGCAVGPDYRPAEIDAGQGWTEPETAGAAVAAALRSYGFVSARYNAGEISLLELLDAERGLRATENAYAQTHIRAASDLVALYKALGGGWESREEATEGESVAMANSMGG
jgi:hypothetical protein